MYCQLYLCLITDTKHFTFYNHLCITCLLLHVQCLKYIRISLLWDSVQQMYCILYIQFYILCILIFAYCLPNYTNSLCWCSFFGHLYRVLFLACTGATLTTLCLSIVLIVIDTPSVQECRRFINRVQQIVEKLGLRKQNFKTMIIPSMLNTEKCTSPVYI